MNTYAEPLPQGQCGHSKLSEVVCRCAAFVHEDRILNMVAHASLGMLVARPDPQELRGWPEIRCPVEGQVGKVLILACSRVARPHHEELKAWANQLLLSKTALLEALQQQVEKQQAMADLIKRIKPQDGCATRSAGALSVPSMPQPSLGPRHDGPASAASLSMDRDFDYGKVSCMHAAARCQKQAMFWLLLWSF